MASGSQPDEQLTKDLASGDLRLFNVPKQLKALMREPKQKGQKMKTTMGGSKDPRSITVEQRNNIIRFIRDRTDIPQKNERLRQAVEQFAKGDISPKAHQSGGTLRRWYGYIGTRGYDPDVSGTSVNPDKGKRLNQLLSTGQRDAVAAFMVDHQDQYPVQTECLAAAVKRLNVPLTVNSHNASVYYHRGLDNRNGSRPVRENGSRIPVKIDAVGRVRTSVEQRNALMQWMLDHEDEHETQLQLMEAAISALGLSIKASIGSASVYLRRAKEQLRSDRVAKLEAQTIMVKGKVFTLVDIEALLAAQAAHLDPVDFCPKCGFNLGMHHRAFTVAIKHSAQG